MRLRRCAASPGAVSVLNARVRLPVLLKLTSVIWLLTPALGKVHGNARRSVVRLRSSAQAVISVRLRPASYHEEDEMPTRGGLVSISPRQRPQVLRLSLRLPST